MADKHYFFRDLNHQDNLHNGRTYHSAGIVEKLHSQIGNPSKSGKDAAICQIDPFEFEVRREWRSFDEIELFEASDFDWSYAKEALERIEESLANG